MDKWEVAQTEVTKTVGSKDGENTRKGHKNSQKNSHRGKDDLGRERRGIQLKQTGEGKTMRCWCSTLRRGR